VSKHTLLSKNFFRKFLGRGTAPTDPWVTPPRTHPAWCLNSHGVTTTSPA